MNPKKNIEVPTETPPELEWGDTSAYIQKGKEVREARERKRHRNRGRKSEIRKLHTQQRMEWQRPCKDKQK